MAGKQKSKMRAEQKTFVKNSVGRLFFVGISVLVQVYWIVTIFLYLNDYSTWIAMFSSIVAFLVVLKIYGNTMNAAFKMPWIMLILVFPLFGLCIYLLMGRPSLNHKMKQRMETIDEELEGILHQNPETFQKLEEKEFGIANQARYLWKSAGYPVYQNTDVVFYDEAADGLAAQKEALRQAKKFIFMEYHAIEDAESFGGIKDILQERVKQGVEVRVLYDDIGSVGFINKGFIKRMETLGIECRVFNPLIPLLDIYMNNRDHRKITVIDGKVGFTGGYNLANEYFGLTHPYGKWKDTGLRLEGDAVRSLTEMFLEMWNMVKKTDEEYEKYLLKSDYVAKEQGFVQPYADSPLDEELTGESVYMNLTKHAKHEIYFTTPYLILSDEMNRELGMAAKRGVDVRIITPGIPDKKLVYRVTRSYYARLVRNGVRIYEYTPGFIHSKQCVCDDEAAVVGTINMDYRSLYLHFENGVFLYDVEAIHHIRQDFIDMFPVCREVTEQYRTGRSRTLRISQCILRLLSPLM